MISLAVCEEQLAPFCENDPFGCRILSCAQAYGFSRPFALFWQGNGCAFSLLDGVMTLCGKIENAEETKAFIRASGAAMLMCSKENAEHLSYMAENFGWILKRNLAGDTPVGLPNENPDIRKLYKLICTCKGKNFPIPEFEPFYLDLSHRFRHGTAIGTAVSEDESKLAACAVASAVTNSQAVLSIVAVQPESRRRGLGTLVVKQICEHLAGRTLWVFRAQNENQLFYEQLGFSAFCQWAQCKVI